eukprot:GHVL01045047.1.p1 GENE.GHVL01045047.1~~GHVL01045047.1.p1  ORF type:complete len:312 (-),score=46.64 GHVL01045047.1:20-955(-)
MTYAMSPFFRVYHIFSVNNISTLKYFSNCMDLKELYLRKNNISRLSDIAYLTELQNLSVLWLSDNPCTNSSIYRDYIIHNLPRLKKLDSSDVSDDERNRATERFLRGELPPLPIIETKQRDDALYRDDDDVRYEKGDPGRGEGGVRGDRSEGGVRGDRGDGVVRGDRGEGGVKADRGDGDVRYDRGEGGVRYDRGDRGVRYDRGEGGVRYDRGEVGVGGMRYDRGDGGGMQNDRLSASPTQSAPVERGWHNIDAMPQPPLDYRPEKRSPYTAAAVRDDNILCAILALVKELDYTNLELVRQEIDVLINNSS